jgi:GntR family transcriptional regulator, rspAB operon transcriptional repressor
LFWPMFVSRMHTISVKLSSNVICFPHHEGSTPLAIARQSSRKPSRSGKSKPRSKPSSRRSESRSAFLENGTGSGGSRVSLSERVYQALKRDIIRGVHPAGEALGEKALARRYRGSRTPVREAAVRLQQENLLRIVPNRGYFVSSMTIGWLNEIYEFRAAIEGACAELAARKGNDAKLLDELSKLAQSEYVTNDSTSYEHFIKADTSFHMGIARLTRNQMLVRYVADMRCHMERVMFAAIDIGYYGEAPVQEHEEIIKAIRHRDGELARKLMSEHILQSRGKVLRLASGDHHSAARFQ